MEKNWTEKLIALSSPIQIIPTDAYYNSFYYQVDGLSEKSNYTHKSIREKWLSLSTNPYDSTIDPDIPTAMTLPDLDSQGNLKDLAKEALSAVEVLPIKYHAKATDYEVTLGHLRFRMLRSSSNISHYLGMRADTQNFLSQLSYLAAFNPDNSNLQKTLLTITPQDITNWLAMLSLSSNASSEETPLEDTLLSKTVIHSQLEDFFNHVTIKSLKTPSVGYLLSKEHLPQDFTCRAFALFYQDVPYQIWLPKDKKAQPPPSLQPIHIKSENGSLFYAKDNSNFLPLTDSQPLYLLPEMPLNAEFVRASLHHAKNSEELQFYLNDMIQNTPIKGIVYLRDFSIDSFAYNDADSPLFWLDPTRNNLQFTENSLYGTPVLLPKSFRDNGVLLGDRGYLGYQAHSTTTMQEQRSLVYVAGFFDPGLVPTGTKLILAPPNLISSIATHMPLQDPNIGNGIGVFFPDYHQADAIKKALNKELADRGIAPYWSVKTFREFEFSKDFIEQVESDRILFTLIAMIIILVACSNIISMLLLLVNDKRKEIGILSAMGASPKSFVIIFGLAGACIGCFSSLIGTFFAFITLRHIDALISFLSFIQGHQALNPAYFGDFLPKTLSMGALVFVIITTVLLSLLAGIIPAIKALRINPSAIIRSE